MVRLIETGHLFNANRPSVYNQRMVDVYKRQDMGIPADEPADYDGKGAKPMKEQPIEVDGERYVGTTVSIDVYKRQVFARQTISLIIFYF